MVSDGHRWHASPGKAGVGVNARGPLYDHQVWQFRSLAKDCKARTFRIQLELKQGTHVLHSA